MTTEGQTIVSDEMILNYHLMHPGGDSAPGDPNAAFFLNGEYHLHYILRHPWKDKTSYSFIHVTSPDMLHWKWQTTKLQPSFTGHGMFSGTGFLTASQKPAIIYAGLSDPRHTFVCVAKDGSLSRWEQPHPVIPKGGPDGRDVPLLADPDCFVIDDTYYAYSAADDLPLCVSKDLQSWEYVGPFMKHDMPDVAIGEDISCANFYPLGDKWMLLCISHSMGCRYYIGDWDAERKQFVPETHGRMNWRRPGQSLTNPVYRDFFAPESVLTADGRRVMWAWLCTLHPEIDLKTVQSLPRELSLDNRGELRIKPLRELESLRYDPVVMEDITLPPSVRDGKHEPTHIADLDGSSLEICVSIDRSEADRRRMGFLLFGGDGSEGVAVLFRPESGTLCVGETEAPFAVSALPPGEDIELRIFVDKYLVEVFVNDRQAAVTAHMDYRKGHRLEGYCHGGHYTTSMKVRRITIWKLKPTNDGLIEARHSGIWAPELS